MALRMAHPAIKSRKKGAKFVLLKHFSSLHALKTAEESLQDQTRSMGNNERFAHHGEEPER